MRDTTMRVWIFLLWICLASTGVPAGASSGADVKYVDLVCVVDQSVSLKWTDSEALRFDALEIVPFLSEIGHFRGCLIGFAGAVHFYTPAEDNVGKMSPMSEFKDAIYRLRGADMEKFTDLKAGLEAAFRTLQAREEQRRAYILLFTDGEPEIAIPAGRGYAGTMEEYRKQLDQLVERCGRAGYKIFALAFSSGVDLELLSRMAEKTGGSVLGAESPAGIAPALSNLLTADRVIGQSLTEDVDLRGRAFETEVEVGRYDLGVRVEVYKKRATQQRAVILLTDPDGRRAKPPKVKVLQNRIVSLASLTRDQHTGSWPGKWTVTVSAPDVGGVDIKISRPMGLMIEVLAPPLGNNVYRKKVPFSVMVETLSPLASLEGIGIAAALNGPEGRDETVRLQGVDNRRWEGVYWFPETGHYSLSFRVKRDEVIVTSKQWAAFEGHRVDVRVGAESDPAPAWLAAGEEAEQSFTVAASDLPEVSYVRYRVGEWTGLPEELTAAPEPETVTLEPDANGDARKAFRLTLRAEAPLPEGKITFEARLVPEEILLEAAPSAPPQLKEAMALAFRVGPIQGVPIISLSSRESSLYEGQPIRFVCEADRPTNLPPEVRVKVELQSLSGTGFRDLGAQVLAETGGRYEGRWQRTEPGRYRFALQETKRFRAGGSDLIVEVQPARYLVTGGECRITEEERETGKTVRVILAARDLYRERRARVEIEPHPGLTIRGVPSSLVLSPSGGKAEAAVMVSVIPAGQLPPGFGGWRLPGRVFDPETDHELAEFVLLVKGPAPRWPFVCAVAGVLAAAIVVVVLVRRRSKRIRDSS